MQDKFDYAPDVSKILRSALGTRLDPSANTFMDFMADDILFEFPYAPPNGIASLRGKANLANYMEDVVKTVSVESMSLERCIIEDSTNSAVLEFTSRGVNPQTGYRFEQHYIIVLTFSNGYITVYRDYWNPLAILAMQKGEAAINKLLE